VNTASGYECQCPKGFVATTSACVSATPPPPPPPASPPTPPPSPPTPAPGGKVCNTCQKRTCTTVPEWFDYNQAWFCLNPSTQLYETIIDPWTPECNLPRDPPDGCYTSYGLCINTPTWSNGIYYCKTTPLQVWWYPVLDGKYGCNCETTGIKTEKRQASSTQVVPAGPANLPVISPTDPAAPYLSIPPSCYMGSTSPQSNSIAAGAWAVIVLSIVVAGVILIVGMSLYYSFKTSNGKRPERL